MSTIYHWESRQIQGNFEKIQEKWWVCIDCTRYGLAPYMLDGRVITVKDKPQRLGRLADNARAERAYFRPWEIRDYTPPPRLSERLRGLWLITDPKERDKAIAALRREFKDCAARERGGRPYDATAPDIDGWQRWALEPLDWTLLNQAGAGSWPLPPNQFSRAGGVDLSEVFAMFDADTAPRGRRYV